MDQSQIQKHTIGQSLLLHLLPGIIVGTFYFLIRKPLIAVGYPSVFALAIAAAVVLIPIELGLLLLQGKKLNGRWTLSGVISYRFPLSGWQTAAWVLVLFVATGIIFTLLKPLESTLHNQLFTWMPTLDAGLNDGFSKCSLIITYLTFFVFLAVLAPWTEELYFRGYLLPRMQGPYAPFLHSFFFAVYHIFTPWLIITRTIGLLPLIYIIQRKGIRIGIITHILLNSLDVIAGIVFILQMT